MAESRTIEPNEDPVCGMTVDRDAARSKGLMLTYEGVEYGFALSVDDAVLGGAGHLLYVGRRVS